MRIIYKLLIGMLIFNALYLSLSPFFQTTQLSATDPTGTTLPIEGGETPVKYQDIGSFNLGNMLITGISVFIGAIVIGIVSFGSVSMSLGTIIGVSTVVGVIAGLWRGMSEIFSPMLAMGGSIASDFYTIFTVVLGVIITLTIAEMFSGQSGVDT